jgi:lysine 6-dehydrogenase
MKTVVVLGGAGAMGQIIVRDLLQFSTFDEIVIADFDKDKAVTLAKSLKSSKVKGVFADLKDHTGLVKTLSGAHVLVNSTPYVFNVRVMEAALAASCHYLDLGGMFHVTLKQLELNEKFRAAGLLAILGMGAAPGLTNVMAASAALLLERITAIDVVVGCADFTKSDHPFLVPYALDTILDEYTMQPMVYEEYDFQAKQPLDGEIEIDFPQPVGRVKAIYTLHSEVATLPTSFSMKGLQTASFRLGLPPEFHDRLKFLVGLGFGVKESIKITGRKDGNNVEVEMTPRVMLAEVLKQLDPSPAQVDDCEVIRVDVSGTIEGAPRLIRMESLVMCDKENNISCGALDTGVPPSIVAEMINTQVIARKGVLAPENCVPQSLFFEELVKRNIVVEMHDIAIDNPKTRIIAAQPGNFRI